MKQILNKPLRILLINAGVTVLVAGKVTDEIENKGRVICFLSGIYILSRPRRIL